MNKDFGSKLNARFADAGELLARSSGLKPLVEYSIGGPARVSLLSAIARGVIDFVAPATVNAWGLFDDKNKKDPDSSFIYLGLLLPAVILDLTTDAIALLKNTQFSEIISSKIALNLFINFGFGFLGLQPEPSRIDHKQ